MTIRLNKPLILASSSVARAALLRKAGFEFTILPSPYDEEAEKQQIKNLSIPLQAMFLANGKARDVSALHPDAFVIGADQMGEYKGRALGKPLTRENTIKQLLAIQGDDHYQHTAACLYSDGTLIAEFAESVRLEMKLFQQSEIITYVDTEQPFHCCGGYMYEGRGRQLFESVEGSVEAVLGLPLQAIFNFFHQNNMIVEC